MSLIGRFLVFKTAKILPTLLIFAAMVIVYCLTHKKMLHSTWTLSSLRSTWRQKTLCLQAAESSEHQGKYECKDYSPKMSGKCHVLELFTRIDPTARHYDSEIICDQASSNFDLICRLHLKQIGLQSQQSTICCLDKVDKVPRIVYYVIFGVYQFRLVHYISLRATSRFIAPSAIYVVGDQHPTGKWWRKVLAEVQGVRFLFREIPGNISGLPADIKHLSDIVRLQLLYMNGGIYLDTDTVVLTDLQPLLEHNLTLGLVDNSTGMGNAFIMAKRGNDFIEEWYSHYTKYNKSNYYWNSLQIPQQMWLKNPRRVHMVDKIYRPNWFESELLFNKSGYPWRNNYAVHVWSAPNYPVPEHIKEITSANTTIAEIFRYVLYEDLSTRI
ncbi:unnamed protein product [Candidula unifasciata]|uniref:Alpha-1,4-N-acetylglucosaminyltransferase n=1 Tax=Candidula unifasciata TaxID=100452 RepID=A0A8S3YZQ9_9EUPU|nr:unnamed protein product [Candidula unifasciata]